MIERLQGAPFDLVLDVGGSIGEFAQAAVRAWPRAKVVSFEPIPGAAEESRRRSQGRWDVVTTAISDHHSDAEPLWFCENQHTASTMQEPGSTRRRLLGIRDTHEPVSVQAVPLDSFLYLAEGRERILIKIDVEGHEGHVLRGARGLLILAAVVIVEVQQDAEIFFGSPSPHEVDAALRSNGLEFAGIEGVFTAPGGRPLQFDGVWTRYGVATDTNSR